MEGWTGAFDDAVKHAMRWVKDRGDLIFDPVRAVLETLFNGLTAGVLALPFWVVAIAAGLLAWRSLGRLPAIATAAGLLFCRAIGLWTATVETLALVIVSVLLAVAIGVPLGIAAGYRASFCVLDTNPLQDAPERLLEARVLRTFVDGEQVYDAVTAAQG